MDLPPAASINTENLSRKFGARLAVNGVSLSLAPGETLALFGPNGAGKTTLLKILGGLLKPSAGSALIGNVPLPGGPHVRRQIGLISHQTLLYDALTARENVEFAARLYHVENVPQRAEAALDAMKILDRADTPVRSLSRGMKQRVSIARAMVHNPRVILADEPFTGLDVVGAKALARLIASLRDGGATIVLVTHNLSEGLDLATHAAIMSRGSFIRMQKKTEVNPQSFADEYRQLIMESA